MNINEYWQLVVKGVLLLIAVVYDASISRSAERVKKLKAINSENEVTVEYAARPRRRVMQIKLRQI